MKIITLLLMLMTCSIAFSQINFEKGYLKKNNGVRSDVFIKYQNWADNPLKFQYKKSLESGKIEIGNITEISEFGIGGKIKYVKATVDIDQSSNESGALSFDKEPDYLSQTVFLKQLVEGEANLYIYTDNKILQFFYNKR